MRANFRRFPTHRYNTGTLLMVLHRPVTPEMRAAAEARAAPKVKKEAAAAKTVKPE